MNVKLDFAALEIPTMEVNLLDADRTTLNLMFPETKLIERLLSVAPTMREVKNSSNDAALRQVYELVAEILSNNMEGVTITADDLGGKYGLKFVHLIIFTSKYMDFINTVKEAKN